MVNCDGSGRYSAQIGAENKTGPQTSAGINILQTNLRFCHFGSVLLQQYLRDHPFDIILIQDPPRAISSGEGIFPDYDLILSTDFDPQDHAHRPLAAILLRASLHFHRLPPTYPCLCSMMVSTR